MVARILFLVCGAKPIASCPQLTPLYSLRRTARKGIFRALSFFVFLPALPLLFFIVMISSKSARCAVHPQISHDIVDNWSSSWKLLHQQALGQGARNHKSCFLLRDLEEISFKFGLDELIGLDGNSHRVGWVPVDDIKRQIIYPQVRVQLRVLLGELLQGSVQVDFAAKGACGYPLSVRIGPEASPSASRILVPL